MRTLILVLFVLVGGNVWAANFTVINTNDSGIGSLRMAILNANGSGAGPHTITFSPIYPQFGNTSLQSDLPVITVSPVTINGGGRTPIIDGGGNWSILRAASGVNLDVSGINFQFGVADDGGCIATDLVGGSGSLNVDNSFFTGCVATDGGLSGGGAIFWAAVPPGLLRIEDSGFFNNAVNTTDVGTEQPRGGAVMAAVTTIIKDSLFRDNSVNSTGNRGGYGGAVMIFSPDGAFSEITGSTFDGNTVDDVVTSLGWGGALRVFLGTGGLFQLIDNFFTDNSARFGGALFVDAAMLSNTTQVVLVNNSFNENIGTVAGGALTVWDMEAFIDHSTFYQNHSPGGSHLSFDRVEVTVFRNNALAEPQTDPACDLSSTTISGGNFSGNLFEQACGVLSSTGGAISNNLAVMEIDTGPPVGVIKFMPGADPIDGGSVDPGDCGATDARGNPRPLDGDDDGTAICDAGAYEAPLTPMVKDGFENIVVRNPSKEP